MPKVRAKSANPVAESAAPVDLLIYGDIGEDWWSGDDENTAKSIAAKLVDIPEGTPINLRINSPGGEVGEGLAIYNLLSRRSADLTAYIDGYALSMGSVIPLAASRIISPESSIWMLHNPHTIAWGDADGLRKVAETLDVHRAVLLAAYRKRTKKSDEELIEILDSETWLTGAEAVELGLADEIGGEVLETTKASFPARFRASAEKALGDRIHDMGWQFQYPTPSQRAQSRQPFLKVAASFPTPDPVSTLDPKEPMTTPDKTNQDAIEARLAELTSTVTALQAQLNDRESQIAEQNQRIAAQDAQLQAMAKTTEVAVTYNKLRRQAEGLNREGKLSKAQFDKLFGDAESDIREISAADNHGLRLGRIEGALEVAAMSEPQLQTEFVTGSDINTNRDPNPQDKQEDPAVAAARDAIANAWKR